MKKQNKSFADKAKELKNRYKRAATDPLEAQELEDAMEKLMIEQEQVRSMMGIGDGNQMACGGKLKMDGFEITQEVPDDRSYIKQSEPWYRQIPSNISGWWNYNKPQLFKDFPITDIVSPTVNYITGQSDPETGYTALLPSFGAYPKTTAYLDDASSFARDVSGISGRVKKMTEAGVNIKPGMNVSPITSMKTYYPSTSRFGKKLTKSEIQSNYLKGLKERAYPNETATSPNYNYKIGNTSSKIKGNVPTEAESMYSNLQQINGKWYEIDPITGVKIPWKGVGYGAAGIGGAGLLGAGIYGLSQIPGIDQSSSIMPTNVNLEGYNLNQVLDYNPISNAINSQIINGEQYLIPEQLATMGSKMPIKKTSNIGSKSNTNPITTNNATSTSFIPNDRMITNTARMQRIENSPTQTIIDSSTELPDNSKLMPMKTLTDAEVKRLKQSGQKESFWDKNKQYLPTAISGLSNIAGNLILANMAKNDQSKYSPVLATPERINLEPQAEQLRKQASVAKNVSSTNARNLGVNAGQALANMGAVGADIDRNLGANLTNLYTQQEGTNVGTANQFNLANIDTINKAKLYNSQMGYQGVQDKLGYLSGALGTIPGMVQEYNLINRDAQTMKWWNDYLKYLGRNYSIGSPFESGPQLRVR